MKLILVVILGLLIVPCLMTAQDTTPQADSLEQELRILRSKVDSLEKLLLELLHESRDTTEVVDELATLRAAARAAAEESRSTIDSTVPQRSRTQNLSALNPEISVTGDAVAHFTSPLEERNRIGATPREFRS